MKTFAQKIARLISAEFVVSDRAGGRDIEEGELAAFIAHHIKKEIRRGILSVGGECDGEFATPPQNMKHFRAYSALDRTWDERPLRGYEQDFKNREIKTSFYELVPVRMSIDLHGERYEEFKIAVVSGMNPAEMMRSLINNYRP